MLPSWLFGDGVDVGLCRTRSSSKARANASDALCVQIEHEKQVDLQRRVSAVPNLDLFLLQDPRHGGQVRCIRTPRDGLEALLMPYAGCKLTALRDGRQRFWEMQVEPLFLYHSFTLLEVDG